MICRVRPRLTAPLAGLVALAGCGAADRDSVGGEPRQAGNRSAAEGRSEAALPQARAPGLARSNQAEVRTLLAEALRRWGVHSARPRCHSARRLAFGASRYSCRAGGERYRVDWQHYGTGRYVVAAVPADGPVRTLERGTFTISE